MPHYVILARVPNTSGWNYMGETSASNPEDALNVIMENYLDGEYGSAEERFRNYNQLWPEIRVMPIWTDANGDPEWYSAGDLDFK